MVNKRNVILVIACLAIISAFFPWYSHHLQNTALDQAAAGRQAESLHTAEKAASMNPLSVSALFTLAGAQQRLGWREEARRTLIKATELQPENYQTWEQLALYERNDWSMPNEARTHFEKSVELNPQDQQLKLEANLSPNGS